MDNVRIQQAQAHDQPELHALWEAVFGDPPELVQAFFDCFPPESAGWVLRRENKICSSAYLLPGNWLVEPERYRPAGYVYAVATAPEERGKGYAGQLMRALADMAQEREIVLYTRPAEQGLFPWYFKTMDASQIGCMHEIVILSDDRAEPLSCRRVTPEEYGAMREAALGTEPHILLSDAFLRLQEQYADGFFAVGTGCGACVVQEDTLYIPELFCGDNDITLHAQTLLRNFGLSRAVVRTQGRCGQTPLVAYCGEAVDANANWGLFLE